MSDTTILGQLGLPPQTCSRISFTFDCIEIAEQEIALGKAQHPQKKDLIDGLFSYLCPPPGIEHFGNLVYRSYVKEQVERVAEESKIEWPTNTEILIVLSKLSERVPLTHDATKLYCDLFQQLFPGTKIDTPIKEMYESYSGATKELKRSIFDHLGPQNRKRN